MATVNNSRSNIKNNLTIGPIARDGTFNCFRTSDNKPCSDADVQAVTAKYDLKSNKISDPGPNQPTGKAAAPAPKAGK